MNRLLLLLAALSCGAPQQNAPSEEEAPSPAPEPPSNGQEPIPGPRPLEVAPLFATYGFEGEAAVQTHDGQLHCYGQCEERFVPASTFKVPHALIALDTGAVHGPEEEFAWDGQDREVAAWNRNHTLRTAIRDSAVWYFQRVAPRIGRARMRDALGRYGIGNGRIGEDLTRFWLDGSLMVSPVEQVHFWRRLHEDRALARTEAVHDVLEMTIQSQSAQATLRGKTGWSLLSPIGGWFVGSLEEHESGHLTTFAVHLRAERPYDSDHFRMARRALAEDILRHLALPVPPR